MKPNSPPTPPATAPDDSPTTKFVFRAADNSDTTAIKGIAYACLREFGLEPDHRDVDVLDVEQVFWEPGGMFEVLVTEDEVMIGTVGLLVLDGRPGVCELRKMYLPAEWRGKGLGRMLLDRALLRARELGFARMELETSTAMVQAIAMYRRYGFVDIERDGKCNDRCELTMAHDL